MSVEKDKNDMAREPQAEYRKEPIRFFNSAEEMNEAQYLHWLSLTPEQRFAEHYLLITRAYDYKDKGGSYDKIYFR